VLPNRAQMPVPLVRAMPMLVLGFLAVGWIAVRLLRSGRDDVDAERRATYRRDAVVGAALAAGWIGIWGVYLAYDWTVRMSDGLGASVHVVRFYLPALGLIALLVAWLLVQLPRWLPPVLLAVLIGLGAWSYPSLVDSGMGAPGGAFGGPSGGSPGGPGAPPGGPQGGGPPGGGAPGAVPPGGAPPAQPAS
jgi:hypothetical protein